MIAFIDDHRCVHGVGPICRVLGIAPSTYHAIKAVERDPGLASDRARQDRRAKAAIKQAFDGSRGRYGARKVWHRSGQTLNRWRAGPHRREGHDIARCTVERLMKVMVLQGVVRGKTPLTTNPDTAQPCPDDKVNRAFVADTPNQLWVSDFTYVSSWQGMVSFGAVLGPVAHRPLTLHHRRLRPQDRRLARLDLDDHRFRPRCPEPGHLPAGAVRGRQADPPQARSARQPIPVDPIHRAACRGRHRHVCRQCRGFL